jgi:serine/threonine-protein kinase
MAWLETDTVQYLHLDNGLRAVSRNGRPSRVILAADTGGRLVRRGFVFRKPADGTGGDTVVRLARGLNEVVVTPESTTFLVRLTAPGSRDIVQAQRSRDTAVPLVASPASQEIGPALSPDGKWLAYASNESGRYEVYVRPYPDVNGGRW